MCCAALNEVEYAANRARRLAGEGRYRDAIELLSRERPEDLDLQALRELVQWRHIAFDPEAGRPHWPPALPDPFAGVREPPEIQRTELTAAMLGGAIQHHGSLLVRGMITPEQTRSLSDVVGRALDAAQSFEALRNGGGVPQESPWFAPFPLAPGDGMDIHGRAWGISTGGVWTADSPRALFDYVSFLKGHGIIRLIEQYLGERVYLSLGKSTLRRVPPDSTTGWHQDGAFLGPQIRTINCWLALTDCGDDAPGLDLYPRRLDSIIETGTKGAAFNWTVGDGMVAELERAAPVVAPRFNAGDAMLFDQMLLHRTGVRPGMTRERLAVEAWFFAGSTFPMKQMPIAL